MSSNKQEPRVGLVVYLGIFALFTFAFLAGLWHYRHDAFCISVLRYSYWITWPAAKMCSLIGWNSAPPVTLLVNIAYAGKHVSLMQPGDVLTVLYKSGFYAIPLLYFPVKAAIYAHRHPILRLAQTYDIWSLMNAQALSNPCILPVIRFDNAWAKKGAKRPPELERSATPDEWCEKHKLLIVSGNERMLDVKKATALLEAQLGKKFDGKPSDYFKALAAIFMIRIIGRSAKTRDEAQVMLDYINSSCNPSAVKKSFADAFDFSRAASRFDELLKHKRIQAILRQHSFEKTFLMGLLREARTDGKIPCSQFIWLKLIDRPLFYALQGVTPSHIARGFIEAAAPVAQYWAEMAAREYDQTLLAMHIDKAVPALEKRLLESGSITHAQEYSEPTL